MVKLRRVALITAAAISLTGLAPPAHAGGPADWQPLETTSARTDNPLKGFMPFSPGAGELTADFPHTMEWFYLPLNEVVKGERSYDWSKFEEGLGAIAGRGHQAALRFYLDYPTKPTGVPDYLLGPDGIDQSRHYGFFDNNGVSFSPDYNDPRIQSLITDFVASFGEKYEGDPRIGYIATGLVGFWGEQHTWPMNGFPSDDNPSGESWMPEREVELSFYRAWDSAFETTKLLNRYPASDLKDTAVGFHDDSFAVSTLPTADWHFMSKMNSSGLQNRWRTEVIGGEIQPPIQKCIFIDPSTCTSPVAEDFDEAVKQTHVTWLMNHTAFSAGYQGEARTRALAAHASLGYDFAVTEARIQHAGRNTQVSVKITNRGVAPFYYNWPAEFVVLNSGGSVTAKATVDASLHNIMPGQTVEIQATLPNRTGKIAMRVPNPMSGGAPIKFANAAQDADAEGYLTLGESRARPPRIRPRPFPLPWIGLPHTGVSVIER